MYVIQRSIRFAIQFHFIRIVNIIVRLYDNCRSIITYMLFNNHRVVYQCMITTLKNKKVIKIFYIKYRFFIDRTCNCGCAHSNVTRGKNNNPLYKIIVYYMHFIVRVYFQLLCFKNRFRLYSIDPCKLYLHNISWRSLIIIFSTNII